MTQSRLTVANLMVVTMLSAVVLASWRYPYDVTILLLLWGALLVSPWVVKPIRVHRMHYQSAEFVLVPIDPEASETPGEVRRTALALKGLGFSLLRVARADKHVRGVKGYMSLHFNPRTWDVAKVIVSITRRTRVSFLVFITELADETELTTSDSDFLTVTPPLRDRVRSMAFPGIHDPDRLYAVHQARVGDGIRRRPEVDDPDAYMRRTEERILNHHVASGYYYPVEDERVLRPTWKGATLMAWKFLWPVPPLRRAWRRLRAAIALGRLPIQYGATSQHLDDDVFA